MQIKNLAISAFAATALAQQISQTENVVSILQVLQTALPPSLLAAAETNSASVVSQVSSQFAAGVTPTWFTALPSDLQTLFRPSATAATSQIGTIIGGGNGTVSNGTTIIGGNNSTSNGTASSTNSRGQTTTGSTGRSTHTGGAGGVSGGNSGNSNSNSGSSNSNSDSSSSSSQSGNAAAPTTIIGAGLAGAVGLVGLLAL